MKKLAFKPIPTDTLRVPALALLVITALQSLGLQAAESDTPEATNTRMPSYAFETVASDLDYPWSLAFLPDQRMLVSLRSGSLHIISADGQVGPALGNAPTSYIAGQGGYFDVLLDRDFERNQRIYLAFASGSKKANATRVISATLGDSQLSNVETIFTVKDLKNTSAHYGGRLVQHRDGSLLLTTGDGFNFREKAQDPFNQLGKVLRFDSKGVALPDNPFADGLKGDPYVYATGIRSPQGLFYDSTSNNIYLHDHGPKGGDEFNHIVAGENYGWPLTCYGVNYSGARVSPYTSLPGIVEPLTYWVPSIAPSGLTRYRGQHFPQWQDSFFVGGLASKDVRRLTLSSNSSSGSVSEETLFTELDARIRDVRSGPDGYLYLLTDSAEGSIIRIVPQR